MKIEISREDEKKLYEAYETLDRIINKRKTKKEYMNINKLLKLNKPQKFIIIKSNNSIKLDQIKNICDNLDEETKEFFIDLFFTTLSQNGGVL